MKLIDTARDRFVKEWEGRKPIERMVFVAAVIAVVVLIYLWLVIVAADARNSLKSKQPVLRAQSLRLEQQAAELERLRNTPPAPPVQGDLRALVQTQVESVGLAKSVVRLDSTDASQVQLVLGDVAFPSCLALIEGLRAQRIRLDSSRIEAATAPGTVTFTATFVRPATS